jgi:hypothetical protein
MRVKRACALAGVSALVLVTLTGCTEPLPNGRVVSVTVIKEGNGPNPGLGELCVSPDFLADAQMRKGKAETAQWHWSQDGSVVCATAQSDDPDDRAVRWRAIKDCQVGEKYTSGDTCPNKLRL